MRETTRTTLLIWRVAQFLLTEALSVCLFLPGTNLPEGFSLRTGLLAPVVLAFFPFWALEEKAYAIFLLTLFTVIAFATVITLSIVKTWKWVGGACLLLFNLLGVILMLNAM